MGSIRLFVMIVLLWTTGICRFYSLDINRTNSIGFSLGIPFVITSGSVYPAPGDLEFRGSVKLSGPLTFQYRFNVMAWNTFTFSAGAGYEFFPDSPVSLEPECLFNTGLILYGIFSRARIVPYIGLSPLLKINFNISPSLILFAETGVEIGLETDDPGLFFWIPARLGLEFVF